MTTDERFERCVPYLKSSWFFGRTGFLLIMQSIHCWSNSWCYKNGVSELSFIRLLPVRVLLDSDFTLEFKSSRKQFGGTSWCMIPLTRRFFKCGLNWKLIHTCVREHTVMNSSRLTAERHAHRLTIRVPYSTSDHRWWVRYDEWTSWFWRNGWSTYLFWAPIYYTQQG